MKPRPSRSWLDFLAFTAGVVAGLFSMASATLMGIRSGSTRQRVGDLPSLPQRLFGYTKPEVARLLGPPPAAAVTGSPTFWHANTWYYPANPQEKTAVAVQFAEDRVVRVEFLARFA